MHWQKKLTALLHLIGFQLIALLHLIDFQLTALLHLIGFQLTALLASFLLLNRVDHNEI